MRPSNAVWTVWDAEVIDTSHLGFRPIHKIATIHVSLGFIRGILNSVLMNKRNRIGLFVIGIFADPLAVSAAVSQNSNGWTDITPSSYTKIIYVSSSTGNDSTCAPASPPVNPAGVTPCKTIQRSKSFMRDGYPDWLLLKKGDTWTNEAIGDICINGRSGQEPALFSSYGAGARPLIKTGSGQTGFSTTWKCRTKGDKLAVVGLEFYAYTRDPANPAFSPTDAAGLPVGMFFLTPISYLLLEDNKVTFYGQNVMIEPPGNSFNAYIRRNIVANAYTSSGAGKCCDYMSTGLYIVGFSSGITFFENLFDHNGWNDTVPGAIADIFRHNYYIKEGGPPASFIGNMSTNDASGAQGRTGGTFTNNLYVKNPIATNYAINHGGSFSNNVILNSNDLPRDGTCHGGGIDFNFRGASPGTQVSGNIIAHQTSSCADWPAMNIQSGLTGMTITNNIIYQWKTGISGSLAGNKINDNGVDLAGANTAHYSDPNRTVETYDRDVLGGPGTLAHFLSLAKNQSRDNWNSALTAAAVNDYIREGFGQGSVTPPPPPRPRRQ